MCTLMHRFSEMNIDTISESPVIKVWVHIFVPQSSKNGEERASFWDKDEKMWDPEERTGKG